MPYQLVFLDTEFSGFERPALISVGMVRADGATLSVDLAPGDGSWQPADCSGFVNAIVLPLLAGPSLSRPAARAACIEFLRQVVREGDTPMIVTDFTGDWVLLRELLEPLPEDLLGLEAQLFHHPVIETFDFGGKRHNALVDAQALRWAYNWALAQPVDGLGQPNI
jgi:hypothetical protein